jgi:hypothetical protein
VSKDKTLTFNGYESTILKKRGAFIMGTIICQNCSATIDQFENEKVATLYGQCTCCDNEKEKGSK